MDSDKIESLLSNLDDNIDDLRDALAPVLENHLSATASKLPLIDKAQLHVLWAYAIESILFSYLRMNGVDAKEHPVFRELTRVKQYFAKIKAAESADSKPNLSLDKAAASRFIKHALTENDQIRQAKPNKRNLDSAERNKANTNKRKADHGEEQNSQGTQPSKKVLTVTGKEKK